MQRVEALYRAPCLWPLLQEWDAQLFLERHLREEWPPTQRSLRLRPTPSQRRQRLVVDVLQLTARVQRSLQQPERHLQTRAQRGSCLMAQLTRVVDEQAQQSGQRRLNEQRLEELKPLVEELQKPQV